MDDFEKELEKRLNALADPDSLGAIDLDNPKWLTWRADFTKFLKDKLLQSYRNGRKAGQVAKSLATAKPYPHPSR